MNQTYTMTDQENAGQSWKYGTMTPSQVMSGADKLFHKKVIKMSKARGIADELHENPYYKSPYNDDRNLNNFEDDQIFRHQVRAINDDNDIDPSDSEMENDDKLLDTINDDDDIFALRRSRDKAKKEQEMEEEELLESSGDDLDREDDDNLLDQQNDNTLDIDQMMNVEQEMEEKAAAQKAFDDDMDMDMDMDMDPGYDSFEELQKKEAELAKLQKEAARKKKNKRGARGLKVNMKELEARIMADGDDESKRLFNISKMLNMGNKDKKASNKLYDSDGSDYYKSSDEEGDKYNDLGITNIDDDIERNRYKLSDSEASDLLHKSHSSFYPKTHYQHLPQQYYHQKPHCHLIYIYSSQYHYQY